MIIGPAGGCAQCYRRPCICRETKKEKAARRKLELETCQNCDEHWSEHFQACLRWAENLLHMPDKCVPGGRGRMISLWLDDVRPAPEGWTHVRDIESAKDYLKNDVVEYCSLDHDLGACEACMGGKSVDDWLEGSQGQSMPHCSHVGTGYDLCLWMAEYGHWPKNRPIVHSANPVGRDRMRGVIDRYFTTETVN